MVLSPKKNSPIGQALGTLHQLTLRMAETARRLKIEGYWNSDSITNCAWIILRELAMFQPILYKTEGSTDNSFTGIKKCPKQKISIRAFGTDISCK